MQYVPTSWYPHNFHDFTAAPIAPDARRFAYSIQQNVNTSTLNALRVLAQACREYSMHPGGHSANRFVAYDGSTTSFHLFLFAQLLHIPPQPRQTPNVYNTYLIARVFAERERRSKARGLNEIGRIGACDTTSRLRQEARIPDYFRRVLLHLCSCKRHNDW